MVLILLFILLSADNLQTWTEAASNLKSSGILMYYTNTSLYAAPWWCIALVLYQSVTAPMKA